MSDPVEKPNPAEPARKPRFSPGLIFWIAVLVGVLWQREEIAFRFNLMAILRAPTPAESSLREIGRRDDHALTMTRKLWATGRLTHRRAVIEFLRNEIVGRPQLMKQNEAMLLEAVHDPDYSLRELIITGLKFAGIPAWKEAARAQLNDADPAIKIYAMNCLRVGRVTNAVPKIGALLDDSEVRVQMAAAITLERFWEEDFGLESWMGTTPVGLTDLEQESRAKRTKAALDRVRAHWQSSRGKVPTKAAGMKAVVRSLPVLEFVTTNHVRFLSSQWYGKPTFVQFFATYCNSCEQVLPEVRELQRSLGDQINIVGVSLDAVPDDHNHFFDVVEVDGHDGHDHHHGHGHGHAHHEVDTRQIVAISSKLAAEQDLGFEVYYDVTGEATTLTDGGEIPVGICLDANGNLRRRFVGPRSARALAGILKADFPGAFTN